MQADILADSFFEYLRIVLMLIKDFPIREYDRTKINNCIEAIKAAKKVILFGLNNLIEVIVGILYNLQCIFYDKIIHKLLFIYALIINYIINYYYIILYYIYTETLPVESETETFQIYI